MKKVLIAMAISTALLTGCGLFHSNKAWKGAKQENPLEVPPNLDRPDVSEALTIPTVNQQQDHATAASGAPVSKGNKALVLEQGVDEAYKRVGMALERGAVGNISQSDDATHTYEVQVSGNAPKSQSSGFFSQHFSNLSQGGQQQAASSSAGGAGSGGATVTVHVGAGRSGSVVSATGNGAAVSRVMQALRAQLGG